MSKIKTQLDILSKYVMGAGARSVNVVVVSNPQLMHFALLKVHNVRCRTRANIKVVGTLNIGF
uniref:Uncharacterized protein n=1 Tax=Solanum tuberosum TaxID=4113 RepID=M1DWR1_SOLTU